MFCGFVCCVVFEQYYWYHTRANFFRSRIEIMSSESTSTSAHDNRQDSILQLTWNDRFNGLVLVFFILRFTLLISCGARAECVRNEYSREVMTCPLLWLEKRQQNSSTTMTHHLKCYFDDKLNLNNNICFFFVRLYRYHNLWRRQRRWVSCIFVFFKNVRNEKFSFEHRMMICFVRVTVSGELSQTLLARIFGKWKKFTYSPSR